MKNVVLKKLIVQYICVVLKLLVYGVDLFLILFQLFRYQKSSREEVRSECPVFEDGVKNR